MDEGHEHILDPAHIQRVADVMKRCGLPKVSSNGGIMTHRQGLAGAGQWTRR
jgi:hypothetical protein